MLAFFALHRGDTGAAVRLLDDAVALADEHDVADARLDAFWLRAQLAFERGETDGPAWADRFRGASDGSERRGAQRAALDLMSALAAGGSKGWERALELALPIRAAFDRASPLPELHELPIAAMVALVRACEGRGEVERAAAARDAARGWLRGRPHRLAGQLDPPLLARAATTAAV